MGECPLRRSGNRVCQLKLQVLSQRFAPSVVDVFKTMPGIGCTNDLEIPSDRRKDGLVNRKRRNSRRKPYESIRVQRMIKEQMLSENFEWGRLSLVHSA